MILSNTRRKHHQAD